MPVLALLRTCCSGHRQLQGLALQGQLPASLGQLPALQTLNLGSNALSGPLPTSWGSDGGLRKLSFLDVSKNGLTGSLPSQWGAPGQFPALSQLSLDTNGLSGQLPSSWGAAGASHARGAINVCSSETLMHIMPTHR